MKVILKENIKGVGQKYEVVNVSDGYANNFLIPRKLAEYANTEASKKYEKLKAQNAVEMQIKEELTKKQIEMLKEVKIVLSKKANEKGHLFEKLHEKEISKALYDQAKIEIDPEYLVIKEPIKEIGEHIVIAEIGKNRGEFRIEIIAQC